MKKFILVMMAAGMVIGLSSCKKDYTCTCTFTSNPTLAIPIENASKADAEDACDAAQTTYQIADANANCTLD